MIIFTAMYLNGFLSRGLEFIIYSKGQPFLIIYTMVPLLSQKDEQLRCS